MKRRLAVATALVVATAVVAAADAPPLQALAAHAGAGQPVYAEAEDGTVLVAQDADRPVHPASVTKVATTLALLAKLGPAFRFDTTLAAAGPVADGTLGGDLVVHAGGDPFLADEGVALLLRRLHRLGLRTVDGGVRVEGLLLLDWKPDPDGARLAAALAGRELAPAWAATAAEDPAVRLADAVLAFRHRASARADAETRLVAYRSPPLLAVVKALNGYSNNVFHDASARIGGPKAVEAVAHERAPAVRADEIVIDNGAGAGTTNRLSPRAAVALLRALDREVARDGHRLVDVLPVSGVDPGTLAERFPGRRSLVVGKTGTFGSVGASALVGMLRTPRHGVVAFAVLNTFVPVPEARRRQDAFVEALAAATDATPWAYDTPAAPCFDRAVLD